MKLNCIIDTCSCIILSNADFRQRTLLEYFNVCANLKFSPEVYLELQDHAEKNLPSLILDRKRKIKTIKFPLDEYEKRIIGRVLTSRRTNENKGEIDNLIVSIDQIHHTKINSIIFITDDGKAINGILQKWLDSFPVIKLWSSYEVVLFLYTEKIIPSKDIALDLIKEIISFTAPRTSQRSQETTDKLTRLLINYNKKLDNINKALN